MADAKSSGKAKKFISLLASRFKEDKHDIDSQELLSYFTDAVANLPKSKVKTALQKEFDIHFKHLSSTLNVVPTTHNQYKGVSQKTSGLNLFAGGGLEKALKTYRQCKTDEEKHNIYKSLQACYPYLNNTNEIFSTLKQDAEGDDLSAVKKCVEMTIGCYTKRSVLECLSFILGEFSSKYEKLINQQESDGRNERFLEEALQFIVLMNHRWKNSSSDEKDLTPTAHSYEDLMAAILSLYTDVQLISSSRSEKTNISTENLATLIFAVLGHSPEHCMDVLLQVTQLDNSSGEALLPLLRCILERNQGTLKTAQYIKFICLARIGLRMCSSVYSSAETKTSVHKVAERQAAPVRFVLLLSKHNKRLVERLALTKKMTANRVTAHLLGEQQEEDIEALLDFASESRQEREQEPQQDHGLSTKGETQGDRNQAVDQPDQSLFFIDSSGERNDDETQKVEFEEIEVEDAILHRQLKSIIGQLQEPSDSEDEELEFAVDDENVDMFIIDKTPSETTNHNNQQNVTRKEDIETTAESNNNQESLNSSPPSPQKRTRGMDGHEDEKDVEEVTSNGQDSGKGSKDGSSKVKRKSIKSETPRRTATRSSSRRIKKT